MSDYFFKRFFEMIKDPSWPEIENYCDFLKLPDAIINESYRLHGLSKRLDQLSDVSYWRRESSLDVVYVHDNVGYLPIPKCASTFYKNLFHNELGWKKQRLTETNTDIVQIFSLIMEPMNRRLKGIVQCLTMSYDLNYDMILKSLNDQSLVDFISKIMIMDNHTTPYSFFFEPWFDRIHWIPMDLLSRSQVSSEIQQFLHANKVMMDILFDLPPKNVSNDAKTAIFNILKTSVLSTEPPAEMGLMFAKDRALYHRIASHYCTKYPNSNQIMGDFK